jgi:ribosomal-protein-alanine N-acetyltransferase
MPRRCQPSEPEKIRTLQGERLSLRAPQLADAPAVYAYASDPEVTRYLAWPRHTSLADSERFLQQAVDGWECGSNLVWLIEDEGGAVGAIGAGLSRANAGIGYVLARPSWGRGYATEALTLVTTALFRYSPITAVWALCVVENVASRRVLEKSGFHYQHIIDNYFSCPNLGGSRRDVALYLKSRVTSDK